MAWWQWSKTTASNASADGTINWAEGQPPASVNDSARAMMARLAEFRDDTSGLLATGGTATAYTLTTNQGLAATPQDGQLIAFSPHVANGTAATLVADGGSTFPLQSNPGTALPSASLVIGTPYFAKFSTSASAWIMGAIYANAFNIPIGGMMPYLGSTVPNSSFAFPYGQAISRTTYVALFTMVSTTFGPGDGSLTFNLPDLRARALFGLDSMGGVASGRITVAGGNFNGTTLGATGGSQNHTLLTAEMPVHNHGITDPGHTHTVSTGFETSGNTGSQAHATVATNSGDTPGVVVATTGITINNTGSGSAHTILPPAMVVPFILRII